tara:strand:- start:80 stop:367 length:288 start_codon:yes stop_codon:yes gene_type:complete
MEENYILNKKICELNCIIQENEKKHNELINDISSLSSIIKEYNNKYINLIEENKLLIVKINALRIMIVECEDKLLNLSINDKLLIDWISERGEMT